MFRTTGNGSPDRSFSGNGGKTFDLGGGANTPRALAADPEGRGPAIGWLRVPEGKSSKNRLHIDIRVAGEGPWDLAERERRIRDLWPRLEAAGATYVREEYYDGALGHVVMLDPEGNEFCVA